MKAASKHPVAIFLRFTGQFGYWILVTATVAGLLGRYIRPGFFWYLQLAAIMLPYLAWGVVAATLIPVILRKRYLLVVHGLLLLVLAARFISIGPGPESDDGHALSVITYNSPYPQSRESPENEAEFQSLIDKLDPNIISMQETFIGHMVRERSRLIGRGDVLNVFGSAGFEVVLPRADTSMIFYQPVLTNFPVVSSEQVFLSDNPYQLESEFLRVRFLWDAHPVVLYNVHLASYGASKPWHEDSDSALTPGFWLKYIRQYRDAILARAWEVEQIREYIDGEEVPVILAGDFNATRHNWSYQKLRSDMIDVFHTVGTGPTKTYHTRYPFARIDHILVSSHFHPTRSRVIKTERSDHRALWAEIVLRQP